MYDIKLTTISHISDFVCVFLCKQKTAYEMRISDWSSDVCSSDLSLTCDGNSTKSRGTRVPLKYGYFTSENMPCSAWPNSWNVVVTSSQVSSVGLPSGGLGMLRWLAITGCVSIRSDWLT